MDQQAYLEVKQQLQAKEAQIQRQEMIIRTLEAQASVGYS